MKTPNLVLLALGCLSLATTHRAPAVEMELVGFHLGSEFFILTEQIDTSDFEARKCILVFRCDFNDQTVSRVDKNSLSLRIIPKGATTGISYRGEDIDVFVTERIDDSTILLQLAIPYNLTALGTDFTIEGDINFLMQEEEKRSRAMEIPLNVGSRIVLEGVELLVSKVEIPGGESDSFALTFRHQSDESDPIFSVQFYDERMQPIPSRQSNAILDTIHESTFQFNRPEGQLFGTFTYTGPSAVESVAFQVRSGLSAVATDVPSP